MASAAPCMSPCSVKGKSCWQIDFWQTSRLLQWSCTVWLPQQQVFEGGSRYPKDQWKFLVSHWAPVLFWSQLESCISACLRILECSLWSYHRGTSDLQLLEWFLFRIWGWCLHPAVPPVPAWTTQQHSAVDGYAGSSGARDLWPKAASCCLLTALSGYSCFLLLFQFSGLRVKNAQEITYIKNRHMWKQPSGWYSLAHDLGNDGAKVAWAASAEPLGCYTLWNPLDMIM